MKKFYVKTTDDLFSTEGNEIYYEEPMLKIYKKSEVIACFKTWEYWYAEEVNKEKEKVNSSTRQKNKNARSVF